MWSSVSGCRLESCFRADEPRVKYVWLSSAAFHSSPVNMVGIPEKTLAQPFKRQKPESNC